MQQKIQETIRNKRDVIIKEVDDMTLDTPPTTRAFAMGYIFAMQEILTLMQQDERKDWTPEYFNQMFKPR
ncbi:MAG TPA: hypothetical protein ACFYDZ_00270 [Candidatus Brocadiaceae bacterium]